MSGEYLAGGMLVLLALAHSVLGEGAILRPLFAQAWTVDEPRWAVERILRFAWHLTSVAWLALAAIVVDVPVLPVITIGCTVSAIMIFVMLRGHLAWPLFLLGALGAAWADGWIGPRQLEVGAFVAAIALFAVAGLHVYWAGGGRWLFDVALPETPTGAKAFTPGPILTLLVAAALTVFGALVLAVTFDVGPDGLRWLVWCGVAVFGFRAIGDTKTVGFSKSDHGTAFAQADDRWFSPLVFFLAVGASAAGLSG